MTAEKEKEIREGVIYARGPFLLYCRDLLAEIDRLREINSVNLDKTWPNWRDYVLPVMTPQREKAIRKASKESISHVETDMALDLLDEIDRLREVIKNLD